MSIVPEKRRAERDVVRLSGHVRTHFDQSATLKQVDPATHIPVQPPPPQPPSTSQRAHWIISQEEQRLEWRQKYLTRLCEADREIQLADELVTGIPTLLRK